MDALVLKNKKGTFAEIITDFDFGSFKYEYEKNNERSISFTLYKTSNNADLFDAVVNESLIEWQEQLYVIKSTSIKYDGLRLTNEVVAKHIFMEFQKHYIPKDIEDEINSEDDSEEDMKSTMTLKQYLDFGFEGNKLGFEYEIKGQFNKRLNVDDLGGKNGLEHVSEGAELYGYIYFADNKKYYIYDEATFYEMSDIPLIYLYNSSEATVTTTTTDIFNYIQGYGKKKTKKETQNYNPIKPKSLNYSGDFIKEGTWRTEKIGASYSKVFQCKHGNETLEWTLKKMSKGGIVDVYLDDTKIDTYECYSKNAKSEKIVIAQNLSKGKHTFKAVFKGAKKDVDYKKSKPCMYVGTEKSTILNLTAKLKGKEVYHTYAEYTSPLYDGGEIAEAPTIFDENITNEDDLLQRLKEDLNDQPTVEVTTNYLGTVEDKLYIVNDDIKENNKIRFIHKPLGFNLDLKVVKITASHPLLNEPIEVDFSNSPKDILKMQQQTAKAIRKFNRKNKDESNKESSFFISKLASDSIGSVLLDE